MRKFFIFFVLVPCMITVYGQHASDPAAQAWVDSVFKTLSGDQKIAQLMVIRMSAIDPANHRIVFYDKEVEEAVKKYNVGGICFFQGGPLTQAGDINYFQRIARTPILFCIDAENGAGMRIVSVMGLPRQMMLGATAGQSLAYKKVHL